MGMKKDYIIELREEEIDELMNDHWVGELVRCKDCIYWQDNNSGYPHIGCKWREDETPDPDDYCSVGERKEGR